MLLLSLVKASATMGKSLHLPARAGPGVMQVRHLLALGANSKGAPKNKTKLRNQDKEYFKTIF